MYVLGHGRMSALMCNQDLGKPSAEQLALQTELRRLQTARRLDEEEFDNQRRVLQAQLHSEVSDTQRECGKQCSHFSLTRICHAASCLFNCYGQALGLCFLLDLLKDLDYYT